MIRGTATIHNEAGIHCRPSAVIFGAVKDYPGRMQVTAPDGARSDLASMLTIMMLGLTKGSVVKLEVDGPEEELQMVKLQKLFAYEYDFAPGSGAEEKVADLSKILA